MGSHSTQTVHSIHDMIHLKLENTGKQLPKTSFSLDDLRDLESKLVLLTGSKAENRKEVDQFLNVSDRGLSNMHAIELISKDSSVADYYVYLLPSIFLPLLFPFPLPYTHFYRLSTVSVELQTSY